MKNTYFWKTEDGWEVKGFWGFFWFYAYMQPLSFLKPSFMPMGGILAGNLIGFLTFGAKHESPLYAWAVTFLIGASMSFLLIFINATNRFEIMLDSGVLKKTKVLALYPKKIRPQEQKNG